LFESIVSFAHFFVWIAGLLLVLCRWCRGNVCVDGGDSLGVAPLLSVLCLSVALSLWLIGDGPGDWVCPAISCLGLLV
jgi:hypothetical protein